MSPCRKAGKTWREVETQNINGQMSILPLFLVDIEDVQQKGQSAEKMMKKISTHIRQAFMPPHREPRSTQRPCTHPTVGGLGMPQSDPRPSKIFNSSSALLYSATFSASAAESVTAML